MLLLDAHVHLGPAFATKASMFPGVLATSIVELMDSAGIDAACTFAPAWSGPEFQDPTFEMGNAAVGQAAAEYPDRLLPFARVNPNLRAQALKELDRCKTQYGFLGLKLHPLTEHFFASDVTLLRPIFERCVEWDWPVLFHSGYYPTCQPAMFVPLAEAFPDVPIILAHLSYAHPADAIIVARRYPNVYLETSSNSTTATMKKVYESIDVRQFVYGSDIPFSDPNDVLAKIRAVPDMCEDALSLILGGNMSRLLKRRIPSCAEEVLS